MTTTNDVAPLQALLRLRKLKTLEPGAIRAVHAAAPARGRVKSILRVSLTQS